MPLRRLTQGRTARLAQPRRDSAGRPPRDLEAGGKTEREQHNLFRFRPGAAAPPAPATPSVVRGAVRSHLARAAGAIPLKFIGSLTPSRAKRIAALVDTTGHSYQAPGTSSPGNSILKMSVSRSSWRIWTGGAADDSAGGILKLQIEVKVERVNDQIEQCRLQTASGNL
jgi:hypothetical protein